jgi:hypothetical protein
MTKRVQARTRSFLHYLYVVGMAFNLIWLLIAPVAGMFAEHVVVRSDTLRELAYQYYGERRPDRFVGIALYDLYGPRTLTVSPAIVADVLLGIREPDEDVRLRGGRIALQLVEDTANLVPERPPGVIETYTIGPNARAVGFLVPEDSAAEWNNVVALWDGDRVLFLPVRGEE